MGPTYRGTRKGNSVVPWHPSEDCISREEMLPDLALPHYLPLDDWTIIYWV